MFDQDFCCFLSSSSSDATWLFAATYATSCAGNGPVNVQQKLVLTSQRSFRLPLRCYTGKIGGNYLAPEPLLFFWGQCWYQAKHPISCTFASVCFSRRFCFSGKMRCEPENLVTPTHSELWLSFSLSLWPLILFPDTRYIECECMSIDVQLVSDIFVYKAEGGPSVTNGRCLNWSAPTRQVYGENQQDLTTPVCRQRCFGTVCCISVATGLSLSVKFLLIAVQQYIVKLPASIFAIFSIGFTLANPMSRGQT